MRRRAWPCVALTVVTALVTCIALGGCVQETTADDTSDTGNASSNATVSGSSAADSTSGTGAASGQAAVSSSASTSYEGELTPNVSESFFIYVGLIDADTGTQVLTEDEALATVEQTLADEQEIRELVDVWFARLNTAAIYVERYPTENGFLFAPSES